MAPRAITLRRSAWRFAEIGDGKRDVVAGVRTNDGKDARGNGNDCRYDYVGCDRRELTAGGAQETVELRGVVRRRGCCAIRGLLAELLPACIVGSVARVQRAGEGDQQQIEDESIRRYAAGNTAERPQISMPENVHAREPPRVP